MNRTRAPGPDKLPPPRPSLVDQIIDLAAAWAADAADRRARNEASQRSMRLKREKRDDDSID